MKEGGGGKYAEVMYTYNDTQDTQGEMHYRKHLGNAERKKLELWKYIIPDQRQKNRLKHTAHCLPQGVKKTPAEHIK